MRKLLLFVVSLLFLTACTEDVKETYTITFESNGGTSIEDIEIVKGNLLSEPSTPTKEGNSFAGWYQSEDLITVFDFASEVNKDITLYAKWNYNSYSLKFVDEDGTVLQESDYIYGTNMEQAIVPSEPEKEGYTFSGWDIDIPSYMPASDITVTANYSLNSYNIIIKDFDDAVINTFSFDYGSDLTSFQFPVLSRVGYTLSGWGANIPETMPTNDLVFKAEYNLNVHTLTFLSEDGTEIYSNNYSYDDSLEGVTVEAPNKFGYTFTSWGEGIPSSMPDNDVTLTALYTANEQTINFYDYDSILIEVVTIAYDTDLSTVELPVPVREGYTFTGWHSPLPETMPNNGLAYNATYSINEYRVQYLDFDGSVLYEDLFEFGADLNEITVSNPDRYGYTFEDWDDTLPTTMPSNDIVINANYDVNTFTISFFDYNDTVVFEETVDYSTNLSTLDIPDPIRLGYTFTGWDNIIPETMPNDNLSFRATYSLVEYDINYVLYDGFNVDNPSVYSVESSGILFNDPTLEGYLFGGWYDNENFMESAITELVSGSTGDIILYAKWTPITYTITYNVDGGTNNTNPNTFTVETTTITLSDPTKVGHQFIGWYDNEEFTGSPVSEIIAGSIESIILYAKWDVNQWDLTYVVFDAYDPLTEIPLSYGETIIDLALGADHTIALTSEGRVFSWGLNLFGRLGDGTYEDSLTPVEITDNFNLNDGEKIVSIDAGNDSSIALSSDGRVFTFGYNSYGQLGNVTTTPSSTPTEITSNFSLNTGEVIESVFMGGENGAVLTSEGRIFTWGDNSQGQLGNGTTTLSSTPLDITSEFLLVFGETILDVSINNKHYLIYTSDNRVFSWGLNNNGQVGNGSITSANRPVDITSRFSFDSSETIVSISSGSFHSALVTSFGDIFLWGLNSYGQLGNDSTTNSSVPISIYDEIKFELLFNEKVNQVSLSEYNSTITTSFGRVFAWGRNNQGQVGDGTLITRKTPVEITSFFGLETGETVTLIMSGKTHNGAITSSGRSFAWGKNTYGQLGDSTTTRSTSPMELAFVGVYEEETFTVDYSDSIIPYEPLRTGYTLAGWYIDEECTILYTFSTMPDEDVILYGKWEVE